MESFDEDTGEIIAGNQVRAALRSAPDTEPEFSPELEALIETLSINKGDLLDEFVQAPANFARFVERYVIAEEVHLRAKFSLEQTEARLHMQWREKLIRRAHWAQKRERKAEDIRYAALVVPKGKKAEIKLRLPTVADIESAIKVDPVYEKMRIAHIVAECGAKRAKGFCDSSRNKKDMLTNVGMRANAELRVTPLTVANARHDKGPSKSEGFGNFGT